MGARLSVPESNALAEEIALAIRHALKVNRFDVAEHLLRALEALCGER